MYLLLVVWRHLLIERSERILRARLILLYELEGERWRKGERCRREVDTVSKYVSSSEIGMKMTMIEDDKHEGLESS